MARQAVRGVVAHGVHDHGIRDRTLRDDPVREDAPVAKKRASRDGIHRPRLRDIRSDRYAIRRPGDRAHLGPRTPGCSLPDLRGSCRPCTTLVEPPLQYRHRRSLIDHRSLILGAHTALSEGTRRANGSQSFVRHPNRHITQPSVQCSTESLGGLDSTASFAAERARQPDDDFHRLVFCDDFRHPNHIRSIGTLDLRSRHRLDRCSEDAVGIARCDADANAAHVYTDPATATGIVRAGPVGTASL